MYKTYFYTLVIQKLKGRELILFSIKLKMMVGREREDIKIIKHLPALLSFLCHIAALLGILHPNLYGLYDHQALCH